MKTKNKKRLFLTVLTVTLLLAGLLLTGCSDKKDKTEVTKAGVVKSSTNLPTMVDFWSPTCPPCRAMTPLLHELDTEYAHAFELEKVDVSQAENQQRSRENQIQYIPTQIFYDGNGKQIFRHTGFYSKEDILNKWKELGYEMSAITKE